MFLINQRNAREVRLSIKLKTQMQCILVSCCKLSCVILGFHSAADEDYDLLEHDIMLSGNLLPTFQRSLLLPSSV